MPDPESPCEAKMALAEGLACPRRRGKEPVRGRGTRRSLGFTECMAWRERLLRLGATATTIANARRVRIAAQLLLFVGLVFVLLRLRSIWRESHIDLSHVGWASLAGAALLGAIAVAGTALIWLEILRRLGESPQPRWAGIYLQAQLGKYIPGSLWQYAGRAVTARVQGIAMRTTTVSTAVELAAAVLAAGAAASLAGGAWLAAAVAVTAAAALCLGWRMTTTTPRATSIARATAVATILYVLVWAVMGLAFWLTARALFNVPISELAFDIGAFSIAWLAGLVAFFAPGGIGVREAVLVGLLHRRIGTADAIVVAAASRGVLTVVDVAGAAVGVLLLRKPRRPKSGDVLRGQNDDASSRVRRRSISSPCEGDESGSEARARKGPL